MDYQKEAQLTKSDQFHGDMVPMHQLTDTLAEAIFHLNKLDEIKKALFYGKGINQVTSIDCAHLPDVLPVDVLHAIIGKATEAGELLELLFKTIHHGVAFDKFNFCEEIGDGMWYDAIGLTAVDVVMEDVQRVNIAKLRARFPNKFTEYDANNRDLVTERKILENGSAS